MHFYPPIHLSQLDFDRLSENRRLLNEQGELDYLVCPLYFMGVCLGFRVWALGLRVWASGFRVWGLGFRV